MEKLIEFLGECYFKTSLVFENFLEEKVKKNNTTMIIFLTVILSSFAIILILINGFIPMGYKSTFLVTYPLLGLTILIFTAGYYNGEKKRKAMGYNLRMININFSKLNLQSIGFNESDKYNLKLLYRNRKVENKINNTQLVKNKSAASYWFLFSLFHVIVRGGIKDLNTIDRKNFFQMLEESFTMNGILINLDTLDSSYSKWNSKLKNDKNSLKDLVIIKTVFSIQ